MLRKIIKEIKDKNKFYYDILHISFNNIEDKEKHMENELYKMFGYNIHLICIYYSLVYIGFVCYK